MKRTILHISIFSLFCISFNLKSVLAQKDETIKDNRLLKDIALKSPLKTLDPRAIDTYGNPIAHDFKIRETKNFITLEFIPDVYYKTYNYSLSCKISWTGKKVSGESIPLTTDTLELYFDSLSSFKSKDALTSSDLLFMEWTVDTILVAKNNQSVAFASNEYIEIISTALMNSCINSKISYPNIPVTVSSLQYSLPANYPVITFKWQGVKWADQYQLEWFFKNSYGYEQNSNNQTYTPDFSNRSTRVTLNDTSYSIPLVFENGNIFFRVRPIAFDSYSNDNIFYGDWLVPAINRITNIGTLHHPVFEAKKEIVSVPVRTNRVHENDSMNWQHITAFSEDGKRKDVISYFDGTLRSRQQVTKISTDNTIIAAETIYDHQGREAIQVLPAPVLKRNPSLSDVNIIFGYQHRLTSDENNLNFNREDFDLDPIGGNCEQINAKPLGTVSGASKYYSPQNYNKNGVQAYVPDAEGYCYAQTKWENDNSGRIKSQSGIGKELRIGSGHETKYDYSVPLQSELDMLFGNEVGEANHYRKIMMTDPNGQKSIQYKTLDGKVIATALTGDSPDQLVSIDSSGKIIKGSVIDRNLEPASDGLSFESSRNLIIPENNIDVTFVYDFTPPILSELFCDSSYCVDCHYKLRLDITDECGNHIPPFPYTRNIGNIFSGCQGVLPDVTVDTFLLNDLSKGKYTISKKLIVDTSAFQPFYLDLLSDSSSCPLLSPPVFNDDDIHISCSTTCEECDSIKNATGDDVIKARMAIVCAGICGNRNVSVCDIIKQQMLADVSPGGQYALWRDTIIDEDEDPFYSTLDYPLSVLNESNNYFPILGNTDANWRHPYSYYKDGNGTRNIVNIQDMGMLLLHPHQFLFSPSDFIQHWQPSWAESLLPYHPEYAYYQVYLQLEGNNRAMTLEKSFHDNVMITLTMEEAIDSNYLSLNNDPALTDSCVYYLGLQNILQDKIQHYYFKPDGSSLDLAQFVYITGRCGYFSATSGSLDNCLNSPQTGSLGNSGSLILDNRDWTVFRALYIKERNHLIDSLIRHHIISNPAYFLNDCIGDRYFLEHRVGTEGLPPHDPPHRSKYFDKVKRFPALNNAYDNIDINTLGDDESDAQNVVDYVNWLQMQKCQRCPLAANLEALLNQVAFDTLLTSDFWLNKITMIPPVLMEALGINDTVHWTASEVMPGKELQIRLDYLSGANYDPRNCEIHLKLDGAPAAIDTFSWNKIFLLRCLAQTNHSRLYPNQPDSMTFRIKGLDTLFNEYKIEGWISCLNIKDCDLPRHCQTNCALEVYTSLIEASIENHWKTEDHNISTNEVDFNRIADCLFNDRDANISSVIFKDGRIVIYYQWKPLPGWIPPVLDNFGLDPYRLRKDSCTIDMFNLLNLHAEKFQLVSLIPRFSNKKDCREKGLELRIICSYKDSTWEATILISPACRNTTNCCDTIDVRPCSNIIINGDFKWPGKGFTTDLIDKRGIEACRRTFSFQSLRQCLFARKKIVTASQLNAFLELAGASVSQFQNRSYKLNNLFSQSFTSSDRSLLIERVNRMLKIWKQNVTIENDGIHTFSFEITPKSTFPHVTDNDYKKLLKLYINGSYIGTSFRVTRSFNKVLLTVTVDILHYDHPVEIAIVYTAFDKKFEKFSWGIDNISLVPERCNNCCQTLIPPISLKFESNCQAQFALLADFYKRKTADEFYDSLRNALKLKYINKCLEAAEKFNASYQNNIYHYTLYYYDQAGNLVKTVPPKGVTLLSQVQVDQVQQARSDNSGFIYPVHTYETTYKFNSLNQVTENNTPDGGITKNWYDKLGRIILSQLERQVAGNKFNYIKYDILGRTEESGEVIGNGSFISQYNNLKNNQQQFNDAIKSRERNEVVYVQYDRPLSSNVNNYFLDHTQNFLRNRIASTVIAENLLANEKAQDKFYHATYYSYDIHGYVKEVIQEIPELDNYLVGQKIKHFEYEYELVSGLVKQINYQQNQPDQFLHRYQYDADNRIITVQTSNNNIWWDTDARYYYYKHGPLARKELGDEHIQGVDYAYTLQGWLKGINSNILNPENDIGRDGVPNSHILKDAYGFSLSYFDNDYKPIGAFTNNLFVASIDGSPLAQNSLYNGNIRHTVIANDAFLGENKIHANTYRHDQLNRLVDMQIYRKNNLNDNSWQNATPISDYRTHLTYDANGNIKSFLRHGTTTNGNTLLMDSLIYDYYGTNTNKLKRINDNIPSGNYTVDIDQQPQGNYEYDLSGNLTKDKAEGLSNILWTSRGKIKHVEKGDTAFVDFNYNATGQRLLKNYKGNITYYVTDIKGNIAATYIKDTVGLRWDLSPIYGTKRLGVYNNNESYLTASTTENNFNRGRKQYELTNHLGDVLSSLADRRLLNADSSYSVSILSADDYYPFGMGMPGRNVVSMPYKFKYQGQESEDELSEGMLAFNYRVEDPKTGRFFTIDPLIYRTPGTSPYSFSANRILDAVEYKGLTVVMIGFQVGGTYGIGLNGEGGVAIDQNGVYKYVSIAGAVGLPSLSGQASFTYFPELPVAQNASGIGFGGGIGGGEGVVGSFNVVRSSGYTGVNLDVGLGVGSPLDVHGSVSYTWLSPFSSMEEKQELLRKIEPIISFEIGYLTKEIIDLKNKNTDLEQQILGLKKSQSESNNEVEKNKIQSEIDIMSSQLESNTKKVDNLESNKAALEQALETVKDSAKPDPDKANSEDQDKKE